MLPRDLDEAEALVRNVATAKNSDVLPPGFPAREVAAVCMLLTAIIDDLRKVPVQDD